MRRFLYRLIEPFLFCFGLLSIIGCASMQTKNVVKRSMSAAVPSSPAAESSTRQQTQEIAGKAPVKSSQQEVMEADIVRVKGRWLYYLHAKKGLLQIDIKDPKRPTIRASLPIYGAPVEMFVEGHRAFILINDVRLMRQQRGFLRLKSERSAQLLAVDLTHRRMPRILSSIELPGRLREGIARKQGDTVFAIVEGARRMRSRQLMPLSLLAYDVKNPRRMRLVQRAELLPRRRTFRGALSGLGVEGVASFANHYVISATPSALMVATRWRFRFSSRMHRRRWNRRFQRRYWRGSRFFWPWQTMVTRVDVLSLHQNARHEVLPSQRFSTIARFWRKGTISDQFKQSYYRDGQRGIYLGLVVQNEWMREGRRRWRRTANHLHVVAVREGFPAKALAALPFGKRHETLRGSVFDLKRRMVFAITALEKPPHEIIDPLYAISFQKPNKPRVLSQIDGLSGDMNLFRFIEGRRFLLAVGRDTSGRCRGFGRSQRRSRTAISLIDVRNASKIRLVRRECFSFPRIRNVFSTTNRNRDQAHKMIGLASDGERHFVTVPLFFYRNQKFGRRYRKHLQSAVGLMEWDLREYLSDRARAEGTLTNRGMLLHPMGKVRRTLLVKRMGKRWLLNLSDNDLSVGLVPERGRPLYMASLRLHRANRGTSQAMGYRISYAFTYRGGERKNRLSLRHLSTGRESVFVIDRLARTIPWQQGLLLFGWWPPTTQAVGHNIRRAPVLQSRYLSLKPGQVPMLHPPTPWRGNVLPPLLGSVCRGFASCRRAGLVGVRRSFVALRDGTLWFGWKAREVYGTSVKTRQLVWLYRDGKRLKQREFQLDFRSEYHIVPVDHRRFFLVSQGRGSHAVGVMQLWTLRGQAWEKSPWRPLPGELLAVDTSQPGALRLGLYQTSLQRVIMLRWSLDKHAVSLLEKRSLNALTSMVFHKGMLVATAGRHRTSFSLCSPKGKKQWKSTARLPMKALILKAEGSRLWLKLGKGTLLIDLKQPRWPKLIAFRPSR